MTSMETTQRQTTTGQHTRANSGQMMNSLDTFQQRLDRIRQNLA